MNNPILIKRGTLLSVIDNILDPNEQVLWRDKPAKKPVIISALGGVPIALAFLGITVGIPLAVGDPRSVQWCPLGVLGKIRPEGKGATTSKAGNDGSSTWFLLGGCLRCRGQTSTDPNSNGGDPRLITSRRTAPLNLTHPVR